MQAVFEGMIAGLKIPGKLSPLGLRFLAIALSSIWASLIFAADHVGSAIVFSFVLPIFFIVKDWKAIGSVWRRPVIFALIVVACPAVALEPGPLNLLCAWLATAVFAVVGRGDGDTSPVALVAALLRNLGETPKLLATDAKAVRLRQPFKPAGWTRPALTTIALPLAAGTIFAFLLILANPIIESVLASIHFGNPFWLVSKTFRLVFSTSCLVFLFTFVLSWPLLRGTSLLREIVPESDHNQPNWHQLFFRPLAVAITLLMLNGMFAIENALDVWHVWFEGALPSNFTHAEYVHRGAYTLIATAILAGLLMVFALWRGTATEQSPFVRKLVFLWTAQNLLLVASSAKRTFSYINDYGWTEWRLAGLLWMVLVAFGLLSIVWRVVRDKRSLWLVNINLAAAAILLMCCALFDTRGFIAERNVSASLAKSQASIDFGYLSDLGPNSLPALRRYHRELLRRSFSPMDSSAQNVIQTEALRSSVAVSGLELQAREIQSNWRSWTWRYAGLETDPTP